MLRGTVLTGRDLVLENIWFRLKDKGTKSFLLLRQEDGFGSNCLLGRFGTNSPLGSL